MGIDFVPFKFQGRLRVILNFVANSMFTGFPIPHSHFTADKQPSDSSGRRTLHPTASFNLWMSKKRQS